MLRGKICTLAEHSIIKLRGIMAGVNLTKNQVDSTGKSKYAVFLPAISSFYSTYVGKQRFADYVSKDRIPARFENGIEGMNWLNQKEAYFSYKWSLYSAGHANLNTDVVDPKEDMIRNRDRKNTFLLGDSGGFQIGKLLWEGDWKDVNCPKASLKRRQVLTWMDMYMDYGMILDIPGWSATNPDAPKKTGISCYLDAVNATNINNEYFMRNRNGNCKFLNVLQGETHTDAEDWWNRQKHWCDPTKHDTPFEGWAMGGRNTGSLSLILKRLISMRDENLLQRGRHNHMHFLGTSKLEWAVLLTELQNSVRKHINEDFNVTFDCASPFLATANGQIYVNNVYPDRGKWSYRMQAGIDNKAYATDSRNLGDVLIQDKIFPEFMESPISERLKVSDICHYAPGALNKNGKEGRTSWDSFAYALMMGHNVHNHIVAVQEANKKYQSKESIPFSLVDEKYDRVFITEIINEVLASDTGKALSLLKKYDRIITGMTGIRGGGKKEINATTMFNQLFATENVQVEDSDQAVEELNQDRLDLLESEINE